MPQRGFHRRRYHVSLDPGLAAVARPPSSFYFMEEAMLSRKIILLSVFATTSAATTTLLAATEFPNGLVPAEIAVEFAGGGTLHQGLPDDFPPLTVPASLNLSVLGTNHRNQYTQMILLRSTLGVQQLHEGLVAALATQGWTELGRAIIGVDPYGFTQVCHDVHGTMTLNMSRSGDATRLEVQRTVWPEEVTVPSCAEQQAAYQERAARSAFFEGLMPILEMPEGAVRTPPFLGIRGVVGNYSAGSVRIERDGQMEVPDTTIAGINAHFSAQLLEQGWVLDSGSAGDVSAVSTWTRTVAPPGTASERVFVTLDLLEFGNDRYTVTLTLRSVQADGGSDLIVSGTRIL
jgi:hypothetical protein